MFTPLLLQAAPDVAAPPVTELLALLVFGIALLLLLILKLRLQTFLSLLLVSIAVSLGAVLLTDNGLSITEIGANVVDSMGGALGFIATIIGIGAIFGAILEHSGGTEALARSLLKMFGVKKAPYAMLVTGFVVSIPVFLDVALVILAPILYALARDTKQSILVFALPLLVGLAVTHAFVPPTPGPVAVGYILGVNLGWVILFGVAIGFPTALICGPWLCRKVSTWVEVSLPEHVETDVNYEELKLPPAGLIFGLIALPILLILSNTLVEQLVASGLPDGLSNAERKVEMAAGLANLNIGLQIIHFLGHPVIGLLIAALAALYFLGTARGVGKEELMDISTRALGPAGIIILITGAGGVFKGVLISTGIADALSYVFQGSGIPVVILAYLFAALLRIAQGSATVAMLTSAGLMVAFVDGYSQMQLGLIAIAIAAGATGFSHVNDSGFWIVSRYLGMTEAQTLKTWSVLTSSVSIVAFVMIFLVSLFVM